MVRGNEKPHMNKALRKAIMERSRLRNSYLKSRSISDLHAYRKHRNYVTNLNKKTRLTYFESASNHNSTKPHHFWNLCKPFLTSGGNDLTPVSLVLNNKVISKDSEVADTFNF